MSILARQSGWESSNRQDSGRDSRAGRFESLPGSGDEVPLRIPSRPPHCQDAHPRPPGATGRFPHRVRPGRRRGRVAETIDGDAAFRIIWTTVISSSRVVAIAPPWRILARDGTRGAGPEEVRIGLAGRARNLFKGLAAPPEPQGPVLQRRLPAGAPGQGPANRGVPGAPTVPPAARASSCLPASPLPSRSRPPGPPVPGRPCAGGMVDEGPVELRDPPEATVEIEELDDRSAEAEIVWDDEPLPARRDQPVRGRRRPPAGPGPPDRAPGRPAPARRAIPRRAPPGRPGANGPRRPPGRARRASGTPREQVAAGKAPPRSEARERRGPGDEGDLAGRRPRSSRPPCDPCPVRS